MDGRTFSVVIPALDEELVIARAIESARQDADEVIVVDGCSRDRTREVAEASGARVLAGPRGRGAQLAAGAAAATGEWLVFLHADTVLGPGWREALAALPPEVAGGAFRLRIDAPGRAFRLVESVVALRCHVFRLPYGDQGIFARRSAYERSGGFRPLPLMEDVDFVRRLARFGRLAFPRVEAVTSARRWQRHGVLGTTIRNWGVMALYALGGSPEWLARLYGARRA